ncbi:MAG: YncE family protein [Tepidisphaera sp.]|nr:YncE family protein [Tepidisphaera sp.]
MNFAVMICLLQTSVITQPAPAQAAAAGPYHVETRFEVGGEGWWDYVTLDSSGQRLFVPRGTHTMVLDAHSGKTLADLAETDGVHGVALAEGLGKGFTSNGRAGTVTAFDLSNYKPLATIKVGQNPDSILFEPTTKRVFAFNGRSKDASVIDAATQAVVETIPLGGKPEFGVADGKGKIFVNIEDTSELVKIDAASMKVEARWNLAPVQEPSGLAFDAARRRLFSVGSNQKMVEVDADSGKVLASVDIGKGVDGACFDPAGFACASNGDGTLTVVSAKSDKPDEFKVVQTLDTAARARTCVIDPASRRIFLPTAEFDPAPPAKKGERPGRPVMKPGTFKIIVVSPESGR